MVQDTREEAIDLFGNYKAEWLGEKLFGLFSAPAYFPDLEKPRPCVLIGGRGTGKTTVLRSLSYEGQYALHALRGNKTPIREWPYFGFYLRVNTNRVTAFQGSGLQPEAWQKLFSHYLNLILLQNVVRFLKWYGELSPDAMLLTDNEYILLSNSINVTESSSLAELSDNLDSGLVEFEAHLNNIDSDENISLSMQGAPLDLIFKMLRRKKEFKEKSFFFLIDEYENFLDNQQIVVNTLIKHASQEYTFKIGVRELGWRRRNTLNETEELVSPADYVRVDIAESLGPNEFKAFAREVCEGRLAPELDDEGVQRKLEEIFPGLSAEEEAEALGVGDAVGEIRRKLLVDPDPRIAREADQLSPFMLYMLSKRAAQQEISLITAMRLRKSEPQRWKDYVGNYSHSFLYAIADPRAQIRKYYAGWEAYTTIASSNIRYLLELVNSALQEHRRAGKKLAEPVSPETQTLAAHAVGRKNLFELEGYKEGAQLVRLVLGLGRIFEVMARTPDGHSPEQNQFSVNEKAKVPEELDKLLTNAVMHLALVRDFSNKLNKLDLLSYDYGIHPIFAPFFGFSYRKKRKVTLQPEELLGIVNTPKTTVADILRRFGRADPGPLGDQLGLFGGLFGEAPR